MNVTVSFELVNGADAEAISAIVSIIAKLGTGAAPAAVVAPVEVVPEPVKAKKPKRILTPEQKQAILDRFAKGREKAALARGETVAVPVSDTKPEPEPDPEPAIESVSEPEVKPGLRIVDRKAKKAVKKTAE